MKITTSGTQKEQKLADITEWKPVLRDLHYTVEYDSTQPEQTIRDFVANVKNMVSRYTDNRARIQEIEQELVDLEHYIEIADYQPVPGGYHLYRKLAELRRERRACKNENDLLQPVFDYFHATEVLQRLTILQGDCAKAKSAIDSRTYRTRTGVLEQFIDPPKKEKVDSDKIIDLGGDLDDTLKIPDIM
jgi:vacuolar-type H+-ATPase subunit I/STV1